ncbi:MAG: XylR N-terminal domain-containing protein [Methanomassiliicoccales archaeon]|nr:MAG: XylR N-terminal domain-containing protein [Methanomassiliicoccales archaeon]
MMQEDGVRKGGLETTIYMPKEAIKSLRLELGNLLGDKLAAGVLFRFGFRCGEALSEKKNRGESTEKGMDGALREIWEQTGLGNIVNITDISEKEIEIEQEDSTEANSIGRASEPSCDYTRGYLAGIASILEKKKFYCVETECISEGKKRCVFKLVMFPHRVYVPKKT